MAATYQTIASTEWQAANITIDKPTGTVDGDLMVAIFGTEGGATHPVTPPAGWTEIIHNDGFEGAGGGVGIIAYKKIASSEGANYSFTCASNICGAILRITNFHVADNCYVSGSDFVEDAGSTPALPNAAITPSISDTLLILVCAVDTDGTDATNLSGYTLATSNPSWTELVTFDDYKSTRGIMSISVATRPETTSTGTISFSQDGGTGNDATVVIIGVKRIVDFTSTILDTTTVTDIAPTVPRARVFTQLDTVTNTDSLVAETDEWSNDTKPTTSWSNTSK